MGSNISRFDAIRTAAIASVTGSYTPFGPPLAHAMRILDFTNDSNGVYFISFDGVTDNIILPSNGYVVYDVTASEDVNESFRYQSGTQLYIRSIVSATTQAMSSNSIYCTAEYGKGE